MSDEMPATADAVNGKMIGQYFPGLADACRRAYRLTIDAMRDAAKAKGYALGVHGSLARDIDLIAVPWSEDAASAEDVAEAIRAAAEKANPLGVCFAGDGDTNPRPKPHGRLCWSFHLGGGPYIDLSVMPRQPAAPGIDRWEVVKVLS